MKSLVQRIAEVIGEKYVFYDSDNEEVAASTVSRQWIRQLNMNVEAPYGDDLDSYEFDGICWEILTDCAASRGGIRPMSGVEDHIYAQARSQRSE